MLLLLADYLDDYISFFHVFNYLTFRVILGILTALLISFIFGPKLITKLNKLSISQNIRLDGPKTHLVKTGTPTMGGTLILLAIFVSALLWTDLSNRFVWVVMFTTFAFGMIGFVDDYKKIQECSSKGLSAFSKYLWQSLVALSVGGYLYTHTQFGVETLYFVPFFKNVAIDLGPLYIAITYIVITGSSNAVNLTDGLDGLAIMPAVLIGGALGLIAYLGGHSVFSLYLNIPHIPGIGELVVFCAAMGGAGIGFLWFNTYPAQVFMGDVGALALGASLGVIAVLTRHELVFFIMAGVYVVETLSVMLQVASYKLTGKRVLRMAPLHHHFELKGWPEPKVIVRFWIITAILVLVGLATLKLR